MLFSIRVASLACPSCRYVWRMMGYAQIKKKQNLWAQCILQFLWMFTRLLPQTPSLPFCFLSFLFFLLLLPLPPPPPLLLLCLTYNFTTTNTHTHTRQEEISLMNRVVLRLAGSNQRFYLLFLQTYVHLKLHLNVLLWMLLRLWPPALNCVREYAEQNKALSDPLSDWLHKIRRP